jgi:S1-C subfamily serine protease
MNLLDVLILVWVAFAAWGGYRRGASLQLLEYTGLFAGLFVGAIVAPRIAALASSDVTQAVLALVVLLSGAAVGEALGWMVGRRAWAAARRSPFRPVDAVAGSIVGVVAVLLAVWFLTYNLVNGPFPTLSRAIRSSAVVGALDSALPPPPSLLAGARKFLDRFGFPQVFAELPPVPAGPVTPPASRQVRRIASAAAASTVRIEGAACGFIEEGSGFVAASHYVVTNAHVVAGVAHPTVQMPADGTQQSATPVLFDPRLDLAVLYVSETPGPALALAADTQQRGAGGAILGYPGGGPLTFGSGAVRRDLLAEGRDIYGRSLVSRHVYELQASVRPGNSGGPFVLPDGAVAGIVFAASTTDPDVGYALTSVEVRPELQQAEGRTAAVSTQGCTR